MAANIKGFIRKWNNRTLEDDGARVSKEFHSFQVGFMNTMRKIADSLGGELVNHSYGHYDMSGFIKRGDRYVYFHYDNCCGRGGRTHIVLKEKSIYDYGALCPMYCRTAANEKDYRGGNNNWTSLESCEELFDKLLNTEHHGW